MPTVSGWQTGTVYHDSVAYSAVVYGTSTVRLKARLRRADNNAILSTVEHGQYGSGVRAGGTWSLQPETSYYWEAQAYESPSSYTIFEYCGGFTTPAAPPPPVVYPDQPRSLSTGTPYETYISFQGLVSHPEGKQVMLQAQLYDNDTGNYITTFSTSFVESNSFAFGTFTGLTSGKTYKWYAYTTDSSYNISSTVYVGTFTTKSDRNPNTPTSLGSSAVNATTVDLYGTVTELDGQQIFLRVFVYRDPAYTQPQGLVDGYNGNLVSSGGISTARVNGLAMATTYYWTAQTVDNGGAKASSRVAGGQFTTPSDWKWSTKADANGNKIAGSSNPILLASEWNSFTGLINQTRSARGYPTVSFTVGIAGADFTASMLNEAIGAINYMKGTGIPPRPKGYDALASDLNTLKNTLNSVT